MPHKTSHSFSRNTFQQWTTKKEHSYDACLLHIQPPTAELNCSLIQPFSPCLLLRKEKALEMAKEDLEGKPDAVKEKIVSWLAS